MLNRLKRWIHRKNTLDNDPIKNTLIGNMLIIKDHLDQTTASTICYVSKTYLKNRNLTIYRLYTNWNNYAELYYKDNTFVLGTVISGDPTSSTPIMTFENTFKNMGGMVLDSVHYVFFTDTVCTGTTERIWTDGTQGAQYSYTRFKDWVYCEDNTDNYMVITQDNTRFPVLTTGSALMVGLNGFRMVKNLDTNITEVTLSSKPHRMVDKPDGRRGVRELTDLLRIPDGGMYI